MRQIHVLVPLKIQGFALPHTCVQCTGHNRAKVVVANAEKDVTLLFGEKP